ncbi:MAG: GntR family transcriptional regulator [Paracoccaceae bacterium]
MTRKLPDHELVYRQIREMILFGELVPGQAVTIQGLVHELGVGMTPVREAIRRLTAEGALQTRGNRRICLPELSPAQLDELSFARLAIEPHIAALACERMNTADIGALKDIDDSLNVAIAQGNVRAYLEFNYRFHATLYRHSGARILTTIAGTLWLRLGPSLRVVRGRFGTANLPDKHKEALAGLAARDPLAVARAIGEDLNQGHEGIRASFQSGAKGELD